VQQNGFFRKVIKTAHTHSLRVINVDKNVAYSIAIKELKVGVTLPQACELQQSKYLNNSVKQDHRLIKKLVNLGLGFKSFHPARKTLMGYETMNSIRKDRLVGLYKGDILDRVKFIAQIFEVAV
jgi:transposase, IS6 family